MNFINANQAFEQLALNIYNKPDYESAPRGQYIKECCNVTCTIDNPVDNIVYNPSRNISTKYLVAEFLWYLLAKQDKEGSDFIVQYAKFWDSIRNTDGSLNSNYGCYVFNKMKDVCRIPLWNDFYFNNSQFDWVIESLKNDKDSRQALININGIFHKGIDDIKDFPCTTSMHFMIRNNQLNLIVHMRSCDIVLGFCNDVFQFTEIQKLVYFKLLEFYPDLKLGSYTLLANSLHLYERHFKMIENLKVSERVDYIDKNMEPYTREMVIDVLLNNDYTNNDYLNWMKKQLGEI